MGVYQTNCYILRTTEATRDCLIVDTGLDADELLNFLNEHNLNPLAVILTHGHVDHTAALPQLRKRYPDINVYIHKLDAEMLTGAETNLSTLAGKRFTTDPADFILQAADQIDIAGISLEVLHTPGHTPGGICLYSKNEAIIFTGDALFAGSIGRTDFPGGNMTQLIDGIKENLFTLPDETAVYPGHGPATTLANEKANNPFLR